MLARHLGCAPRAVVLGEGDGAKPVLARPCRTLHFNLSHAGAYALVAVSRVARVGVDVEPIRSLADFDALVRRSFAPAEQRAWQGLPCGARAAGFFRAWTRKEAAVKASGEGLGRPLEQVEVGLERSAHAQRCRLPCGPVSLRDLVFDERYAGALAVCGSRPGSIRLVDYPPR